MSDLFADLSLQALGAAQAAPAVSPALAAIFAPGEAGLQSSSEAPGAEGFTNAEPAVNYDVSEGETFSNPVFALQSGNEAANIGLENAPLSFPGEDNAAEKQGYPAASESKNESLLNSVAELHVNELPIQSPLVRPGTGAPPRKPIESVKPHEIRQPFEQPPAPVKVPQNRPEADKPARKLSAPELTSQVLLASPHFAAQSPAIPAKISEAQPAKSEQPAAVRPASRQPEPFAPENETIERPQTPIVTIPRALPIRHAGREPGIEGEAALNPVELLRSSAQKAPAVPGAAPGSWQRAPVNPALASSDRSAPVSKLFPAEEQDETQGTNPRVIVPARPAVPVLEQEVQPSPAPATDSRRGLENQIEIPASSASRSEIQLSRTPSKPPVSLERVQPARMEDGVEQRSQVGSTNKLAESGEEEAPVIRVSIGRVVVRASTSQDQPVTRSVQRAQPTLSLDDYLKNRRRRAQ
jgi:hypothetical protein